MRRWRRRTKQEQQEFPKDTLEAENERLRTHLAAMEALDLWGVNCYRCTTLLDKLSSAEASIERLERIVYELMLGTDPRRLPASLQYELAAAVEAVIRINGFDLEEIWDNWSGVGADGSFLDEEEQVARELDGMLKIARKARRGGDEPEGSGTDPDRPLHQNARPDDAEDQRPVGDPVRKVH